MLYALQNNVEKQYQSLCESWRVELEEKQRQLEAAKAQILGPRCGQGWPLGGRRGVAVARGCSQGFRQRQWYVSYR